MISRIKKLDRLTRDMLLVFLGTSFVNFLNLLYQLFVVRKLTAENFAAFNTLLSILILLSVPASTLMPAMAKFSAKFMALHQEDKISLLISTFSRLTWMFGLVLFALFCILSSWLTVILKIPDSISVIIMAFAVILSWVTVVYSAVLQGLERFGWFTAGSVFAGILKLGLGVIFILIGWNIAGALGAYLLSSLFCIAIYLISLKKYLFKSTKEKLLELREIITYIFPAAVALFCFAVLTGFDMVLVKYFFSSADAGFYSIGQMVGKICLFLPGAISIVMFPKTAGLNAKNEDTTATLKKSLIYASILCLLSVLVYNIFPVFVLNTLTGKVFIVSIKLGRLFTMSMGFYALVSILVSYHLSISDFRFLKPLAVFTVLQVLAIVLFHRNLFQVQLILCVNAFILFLINMKYGLKETRII